MIELQGKPMHSLQQKFAGDTCNTAIYFNRLAESAGIETFYITAIGTDPFSEAMSQGWMDEGINCRFVQRLQGRNPGIYHIAVDDRGERSFSYWRGESAARFYFSSTGDLAPPYQAYIDDLLTLDVFYLSGISLAILPDADREALFTFISEFKNRGGKICFDNNYRPRLWPSAGIAREVYDRLLPLCDLAFLTLEDEAALFGADTFSDVLKRMRPFGVEEIIIRQGAEDCVVYSTGKIESVPAQAVRTVVDTTAAGDSFSAAYLAARLQGKLPAESAFMGHRLAGRVIQYPGAIIPAETMLDMKLEAQP